MENEIRQYLDYLKFEKRYSAHTLRSYGDDLVQFLDFTAVQYGQTPLKDLNAALIRSWLAGMKEEGMASRTLNRRISTLRSFFKYCMRTGILSKSPMTTIVSPRQGSRLPVFVEEQDMGTLLEHVEFTPDWAGNTARLALTLLYSLGLRLSELVNCRESQVDHGNRQLRIIGKGNKERLLPLNTRLLSMIAQYMDEKRRMFEKPDVGYLLVTDKGLKLYPKYIYRVTRSYLSQVTTIDKKSPHVLRHSFATHLMNNGAELNAVKELLGHASLAATQVYTHNTIEKLKNVHHKAHPKG